MAVFLGKALGQEVQINAKIASKLIGASGVV